jgi:hypothetical protein
MKCRECEYSRLNPGNYHLRCAQPDAIVDCNPVGIAKGYCYWPFEFDPVWIRDCDRFEEKKQEGVVNE